VIGRQWMPHQYRKPRPVSFGSVFTLKPRAMCCDSERARGESRYGGRGLGLRWIGGIWLALRESKGYQERGGQWVGGEAQRQLLILLMLEDDIVSYELVSDTQSTGHRQNATDMTSVFATVCHPVRQGAKGSPR
jgi:hypothetical protein